MNISDASLATPAAGARTSYLEVIERRRSDIRAQLSSVLAGSSTFTWELGCGHGHFLTAYAQAHPDKLCVGIDIVSERIQRAARKRDRARLANLHFVHAEARLFLDALPPRARFSELFILFPDPWPKLRHHKHRILQPDFLAKVAPCTVPSSQLYFRTDYAPYFEDAHRALRTSSHWQVSTDQWPFEYCTVFQSRAANYQSLIAHRSRPAVCL